jgi:spermidine/putrescine transport system ATP-binding protein
MQMQVELKSLQHRVGTTFIYVTHDQGEALVMSDRIAVMSDGRVMQVGSGRDIYLRPQTTFVAAFIGETNLLEGEVVGVDGEIATISTPGGDVRALCTGPLRDGQRARVSLRPEVVRLTLSRAAVDAEEGLLGTVGEVIFLGSQIRYEIALPSGGILKVDRPTGEDSLAPGDAIVATWDPTSVVVIPDDAPVAETVRSDLEAQPA